MCNFFVVIMIGGGGDTFLAGIFSKGGGRGCDVWMGEGSWVGLRVLGEYMIAPEKLFVMEVVEIVFLVSTMVEGDTFFAHISSNGGGGGGGHGSLCTTREQPCKCTFIDL